MGHLAFYIDEGEGSMDVFVNGFENEEAIWGYSDACFSEYVFVNMIHRFL